MKLRILTAMLALAMVIACLGAAQAEPYKLIKTSETKEFNKDIVNPNPARYDTTVMLQPGARLITSLADIVLDADPSYRDFKTYTGLNADRATANIGGDIYTNINVPFRLTEVNGAALEASDLTVNDIIAYVTSSGSLPEGEKTLVSLLKFYANKAGSNSINANNLIATVNTKGSNVLRGIDMFLFMKDANQTVDLNKGISLDSYSSDGSVNVTGIALDDSEAIDGSKNVNISVAGNIEVSGRSDGTAGDTSVTVSGFSNDVSEIADCFTSNLVLSLQDVIANAIAKNETYSTAVELSGANGTDHTVSATLPGKLISSATSVFEPSSSRALLIRNENVTADLLSPDNARILASALASQSVSTATALHLNGGNITVSGNRDAAANAVGIESNAEAVSATGLPDSFSAVSMNNLLADAAAQDNAESTGIYAMYANVSANDVTADSIASGLSNTNRATSVGINAEDGSIVTSSGNVSVFSSGNEAYSTGIIANDAFTVNVFGNTAVTAISPRHADAIGLKNINSYPSVGNITVSSQSPIYSLAIGISSISGPSIANAKNVDVTAAGGSPNAFGVVSEGNGTDVTVDKIKSTIIKEGSNAAGRNVGAVVKNGAQLTVNDDVLINTGTGLETDNTARVQVKGSVQADDLFKGGKVIDMTVKPGVSPLPITIGGASVIYGGDLLHLTADGFADRDEFLDAVPTINVGKLYLVDNLNDVISGTLNGKPIDSDTVGRIIFDKFDNLDINYMFGWEPSGEHYTIDYMDTDKLEYEAEYDVYTGQQGTDIDFHITTDPGYAVTEIATGGYTDAVPMEEEGWYYVTIPGANGVYITVKVSKTVYAALQRWYFYGMDPETKERAYWLCTKVEDGKAKLISLNGFEKTPDDLIENWLSKEEQENLKSDGYYLDAELSENIFADGLEHPIIEVNLFYIDY